MTYINFELYQERGLLPEDIYYLIGIKQIDIQILEWLSSERKSRFEDMGLLTSIKGKPKEIDCHKIRLSKKGKQFLEDIATPVVSDGDLQMAEYLFSMYLNHEDKERVLGNRKLIRIYIAILRNHLDLTLHQFFYLCEFFLAEHVFTKKLENIFMDKNKVRYGTFQANIESSTLYQFYEQRIDEVERYWTARIKED